MKQERRKDLCPQMTQMKNSFPESASICVNLRAIPKSAVPNCVAAGRAGRFKTFCGKLSEVAVHE
jgi:hypothetical protein